MFRGGGFANHERRSWDGVVLFIAALDAVFWRTVETDTWVARKTAAPADVTGYGVITTVVARRYWQQDRDVPGRG